MYGTEFALSGSITAFPDRTAFTVPLHCEFSGLWCFCNDASVSPIPSPPGEAFTDPKAVFAAYALERV